MYLLDTVVLDNLMERGPAEGPRSPGLEMEN